MSQELFGNCRKWKECGEKAEELKKKHSSLRPGHGSIFESMVLVRIINGSAYYDWPWGVDRIKPDKDVLSVLMYTSQTISDMPDSVFLVNFQQSYLPWNIPLPAFSNSPSFKSGEFVLPWIEGFRSEYMLYKLLAKEKNFTSQKVREFSGKTAPAINMPKTLVNWEDKIPKAAAFVSYMVTRHIFFDLVSTRPDLFEGCFEESAGINPWNPSSREEEFEPKTSDKKKFDSKINGYVGNILSSAGGREYNIGSYKYLVIMTGGFGENMMANTGKLATFLSHSGAVILIQKSEFNWHFSARLVPWVHFVPLSYSMAELVEVVQYLRAHDHLAKQIAENARAFGDSFLRLEDYYCYMSSALSSIGNALNKSDVLVPYNPKMMPVSILADISD